MNKKYDLATILAIVAGFLFFSSLICCLCCDRKVKLVQNSLNRDDKLKLPPFLPIRF
jgi:hypothetical protein